MVLSPTVKYAAGVRPIHVPPSVGKPPGYGRKHRKGGRGASAPIYLIWDKLIRARFEPGFAVSGFNRSPYRAPFKKKLKSALFWQSDEFKRSHRSVLQPDPRAGWVFVRSRKKRLPDGFYCPITGII